MTQVHFYHLTTTGLEHALPALAAKALQAGFRVGIALASETQVKQMDDWLWKYDPDSFLPHGTAQDANAAQHPICLSSDITVLPNSPEIVMVANGTNAQQTLACENPKPQRILDIFSGANPQELETARQRWREYKDAGATLTYWQQQPSGGWKAVA